MSRNKIEEAARLEAAAKDPEIQRELQHVDIGVWYQNTMINDFFIGGIAVLVTYLLGGTGGGGAALAIFVAIIVLIKMWGDNHKIGQAERIKRYLDDPNWMMNLEIENARRWFAEERKKGHDHSEEIEEARIARIKKGYKDKYGIKIKD